MVGSVPGRAVDAWQMKFNVRLWGRVPAECQSVQWAYKESYESLLQ